MYDLLILGGSAAGASAAIYAARAKMNFKVIAKDLGGEVANSGEIGNYPGFNVTNGVELSEKFAEQMRFNQVDLETGVHIERVAREGNTFIVTGRNDDGQPKKYEAKAVILATGARPRHLNVPGEQEYYQKGLSYCTTCDGPLFRQKAVATIGGGNAALESILMMSGLASRVYSININTEFSGEKVYIEKVKSLPNVSLIASAQTATILGGASVSGVEYFDKASGEKKVVEVQGVFIHIGILPNTDLVKELGVTDKLGFVEVNTRLQTVVPGLFAAGDVVNIPYQQIAIATGHGVAALLSAQSYLNKWQ